MEFGGGRKRAKQDSAFNGNGAYKKAKQETDSTGIGSKLKPCTKFYSTSGCQFGDGCHFSHHVPGGFKAMSLLNNFGGNPAHQPGRNSVGPPSFPDGPSPLVKIRLCTKFKSAEGCRFGDKCRFAHGEWELGRPALPSYEDPRAMGPMHGRYGGNRIEPSPPGHHGAAGSFGASATAKISVDASLGGAIIGKGGVHTKQICRVTGAKLSVRDHESDSNLKNIELEGTFDQIKQASAMVHELIVNLGSTSKQPMMRNQAAPTYGSSSSNFKTKLCEKFAKGSCTFGEKCHFAHGEDELRKSGV